MIVIGEDCGGDAEGMSRWYEGHEEYEKKRSIRCNHARFMMGWRR